MKLSNQAITDFKEAYQKYFGVVLSDEEVNEKGMKLMNLMKLIYKPIPEEEFKNLNYGH